jgi:hypothetical protein
MIRHWTTLNGALVSAGQVLLDEVSVHADTTSAEDDALVALDEFLFAV